MRKAKPIIVAAVAAAGLIALGWFLADFATHRPARPPRAAASQPARDDLARRLKNTKENGVRVFEVALDPNISTNLLVKALDVGANRPSGEAAQVLGLRGDANAVPALLAHCQGHEPRWCLWALGRIRDSRAVEPLIAMLEESTRQIAAAGRAGQETEAAIGELNEAALIEALGELGDDRAVKPLIARLAACNYDGFENTRRACKDSLSQLGPAAAGALIEGLETADQRTQERMFEILGRIATPEACECLARHGKPNAGQRPAEQGPESAPAATPARAGRGDASASAGPTPADSLKLLGGLLAETQPAVSGVGSQQLYLAAVDALAASNDPAAGPTLLGLVSRAASRKNAQLARRIGIAAADSLQRGAAPDLFQTLSEDLVLWDLTGDEDGRIGWQEESRGSPASASRSGTLADAICGAIARTGDEAALDCLCDALGAASPAIRIGAVKALAAMGDKRAFGPLVTWLDAGDSPLIEQRLVAEALVAVDPQRAAEPLTQWLAAKNAYFTETFVIRQLGKIGSAGSADVLRARLLSVTFNAAYANLFFHDMDHAASFMERGRYPAYDLAIAYGRCAGTESLDVLIMCLRSPWSFALHAGAAEALGELGDARAVPDLVRALNDKYWPVQRAAATALGRIGDPAAVAALRKAAGYGDWRVRQAAEVAIKAIEAAAESRP